MHGLDRRHSVRLVETAIDSGITHFDTARMYGFGKAESILGCLAPRHRERIVIATKVGILPANRSLPSRALNFGARFLNKGLPGAGKYLTALQTGPRAGIFDLPSVRKSFELSLKQLRTDYVDILLLHECNQADASDEELLEFLESLRAQGKVRAFGLATSVGEAIQILKFQPRLGDVVQIASSLWNLNIKRLPFRSSGLAITHSALTHRFHELARRLQENDAMASEWKTILEIDSRNKTDLARLLLSHALYSNPEGIVLFFSGSPENVKRSASFAREGNIDSQQMARLEELVRRSEPALSIDGLYRDYLRVS